MTVFTIRDGALQDRPALEALYPAALPEEDLLPLLRGLLDMPEVLSLVAVDADSGAVAGHMMLTPAMIRPAGSRAALLGPLAVRPERQRQGIGRALIAAGMEQLRDAGAVRVFVLGDPAYYGRSGFTAERETPPPYPLPDAWDGAWQSLPLTDQFGPADPCRLELPDVWMDPALWQP